MRDMLLIRVGEAAWILAVIIELGVYQWFVLYKSISHFLESTGYIIRVNDSFLV